MPRMDYANEGQQTLFRSQPFLVGKLPTALLFQHTASTHLSRERLRSSAVPFSTVVGMRLASDQRCTSFDSHSNIAPKSKFHKTSCPVACGMSR